MKNIRYKQIQLTMILAMICCSTLYSANQDVKKDWYEPLVHLYYKGSRKGNRKDVTTTTITLFKNVCKDITNVGDISKEHIKAETLKKKPLSKKGYDLDVIQLYWLFDKMDKSQTLTTEELQAGQKAVAHLYNKGSRGQPIEFDQIIKSVEDTKNAAQPIKLVNGKGEPIYKNCASFLAQKLANLDHKEAVVRRSDSSESRESNKSEKKQAGEEESNNFNQLLDLKLNGNQIIALTNAQSPNTVQASQPNSKMGTPELLQPPLEPTQSVLSTSSVELSDYETDDNDVEVAELALENGENEKLYEMIKTQNEEINKLKKKLAKKSKELDNLNEVTDQLQYSITNQTSLESQFSQKNLELNQKNEHTKNLQKKLSTAFATIKELTKQLNNFKHEAQQKSDELAEIHKELATLQKIGMQELDGDQQGQGNQKIENRITSVKKIIEEIQNKLADKVNMIQDLEQALHSKQASNTVSETEPEEEVQKTEETLQMTIHDQEQEITVSKSELKTKADEIKKLTNKLSTKRQKIKKLESDIKRKDKEVKDLEKTVNAQKKTVKKQKGVIKNLEKKPHKASTQEKSAETQAETTPENTTNPLTYLMCIVAGVVGSKIFDKQFAKKQNKAKPDDDQKDVE